MKEYTVRLDESMTMKNKPEALDKILDEMTAQGWALDRVTTASAQNVSRIYLVSGDGSAVLLPAAVRVPLRF